MIVPAGADALDALRAGRAVTPYRLVDDSVVAPAPVLAMLADLAETIRAQFEPAAWLIVEGGEIVGLLSVVKPYVPQRIEIGYGMASSRQNRGATGRAIGELLDWARTDPRLTVVAAETGDSNLASQRVLERNGFVCTGQRIDREDGPLLLWEAAVG